MEAAVASPQFSVRCVKSEGAQAALKVASLSYHSLEFDAAAALKFARSVLFATPRLPSALGGFVCTLCPILMVCPNANPSYPAQFCMPKQAIGIALLLACVDWCRCGRGRLRSHVRAVPWHAKLCSRT